MRFREKYGFLSNFYPCTLRSWGLTFTCAEALYVACKVPKEDKGTRAWISVRANNGKAAKKIGKNLTVRSDWEEVRLPAMESILRKKFSIPALGEKLKGVREPIVEDNYWCDNFWGQCGCEKCKAAGVVGQNNLGILLEKIRDELLEMEMAESKMTYVGYFDPADRMLGPGDVVPVFRDEQGAIFARYFDVGRNEAGEKDYSRVSFESIHFQELDPKFEFVPVCTSLEINPEKTLLFLSEEEGLVYYPYTQRAMVYRTYLEKYSPKNVHVGLSMARKTGDVELVRAHTARCVWSEIGYKEIDTHTAEILFQKQLEITIASGYEEAKDWTREGLMDLYPREEKIDA